MKTSPFFGSLVLVDTDHPDARASYNDRDPIERLRLRLSMDGLKYNQELAALEREEASLVDRCQANSHPLPDPSAIEDGVWAS